MRCPFQQLHHRQDGQTLVEFAIAFPIQILITLGIMQLAMIFVAKQVVNYAAFIAARAELVKIEDTDAANAAAIVCAGISGPTSRGSISVTREDFPLVQLPGWGLLLPPPPRARRFQQDDPLRRTRGPTYYLGPEARSDEEFFAAGGPDKSSFSQAKTYVYRLEGSSWSQISQLGHAPDPSALPMLGDVAGAAGADDRTVVVAVAHDFELVFPFVGEFYAALAALNPRLDEMRDRRDPPTLNEASERWGAPHITLVDVGIQYRSWDEPE